MKGQTRCWILTIFLAAVVLKRTLVTATESIETEEELSDLEGSESTYGFPFTSTFGKTYRPFIYPSRTTPGFTSTFQNGGFSFGFGQNMTSNIHQQIMCGDTFPRACENSRHRSYDGSCNNLRNPTWGMANTRYGRLLPANYADGIPVALLPSNPCFPPARKSSIGRYSRTWVT